MSEEAKDLVLKCEFYQKYNPKLARHLTELTKGGAASPFAQCEIDFVGPLPKSKQLTYIIVAIYYFSKYIEAKALASTTEFQ